MFILNERHKMSKNGNSVCRDEGAGQSKGNRYIPDIS